MSRKYAILRAIGRASTSHPFNAFPGPSTGAIPAIPAPVRIFTTARTDKLALNIDVADRGMGLVAAPM